MEPKMYTSGKSWYIGINTLIPTDIIVAEILDINYRTYIKILKKHGAYLEEDNGEYWFKTKEEVEAAITELEPHYILAKLTE